MWVRKEPSRVWIAAPTREALPRVNPRYIPHVLDEVLLREHVDRHRAS
ncbi:hypothetical protein [Streptomyces sp. NPDC055681]